MTFRNSILAGMTLIREAIQSQNYQAGTAGWKIAADGEAEFADLTIRSSDGSGASVEIENGRATFTAPSGWRIIIDPTHFRPIIYFLNSEGREAGAINATGNDARAGLILSSGPFAEGAVSDWKWLTFMGEKNPVGVNAWHACRVRDSDNDRYLGGWLYLNETASQVAVVDSNALDQSTVFQVSDRTALVERGRLVIQPEPGPNSALWVNAYKAGQTGPLLLLQRESAARFYVQADGSATSVANVTAQGQLSGDTLSVADTSWQTYTPVITGAGSATFNIRDGWWYRLGKLVFVQTYFTVNAAGSGTANVTFSLPVTPFRSSRRQNIPGGVRDGSVTAGGPMAALTFAGGSGPSIDRIVDSAGVDVQGARLTAGSIWCFQGWIREV
ncbi:hypothetical protein ACF06O_30825 [Streptomyces albidoflavus]